MPEDISVSFEHWKYIFPDEVLTKYGSPFFSKKEAAEFLIPEVYENKRPIYSSIEMLQFSREQLLAANEAFPEAALSDPLADLEVWDDWRLGIRSFPYPGKYGPLGIMNQDKKTTATSSVGVIGEIMTGLFAQAGLSPWILVRVIRHWPDFIYQIKNDRYAFVESKAFTWIDYEEQRHDESELIPDTVFGEALIDAISQLNADPFVQVWYSFTAITSIRPFEFKVIFLELDTTENRRAHVEKRILPEAIIKGLSERALLLTASKIEDPFLLDLARKTKLSKNEMKIYKERLTRNAMEEIEGMFLNNNLKTCVFQSRKEFEDKISILAEDIRISDTDKVGRRLFDALACSGNNGLTRIRDIGANTLYIWNMSEKAIFETSQRWIESSWDTANRSWKDIGGVKVWLCGGAVFAVGKNLDGTRIE